MGSALLYRPAQWFPFREQVLLTVEAIQRMRAHAIRQRAIQCIAPILFVDILCEKISQYDYSAILRTADTIRPRRPAR